MVINCISFNSVRLENRSKEVKKYKPALSQTEETTQRIKAVNRREDVHASWLHPRNKLGDVPMTSLSGAVAESVRAIDEGLTLETLGQFSNTKLPVIFWSRFASAVTQSF